jgi:hypothetical protein
MRSPRKWTALGLLLVLSLGAGCTSAELGPTEPAEFGITSTPLPTLGLLSCSPQRYFVNSKVVGPKGDKIKVGSHVLSIPAGALSQDVTIVAEQLKGSVNSVRFSPEGLTFDQPAELTMSYNNCSGTESPKSVVYTDEQLKILQLLRSDDKPQTKTVTSPIDHFSRYAVAY